MGFLMSMSCMLANYFDVVVNMKQFFLILVLLFCCTLSQSKPVQPSLSQSKPVQPSWKELFVGKGEGDMQRYRKAADWWTQEEMDQQDEDYWESYDEEEEYT